MSLLAFDKWARLIRIISQNGGPFKAFYKLWRMDTLKLLIDTGPLEFRATKVTLYEAETADCIFPKIDVQYLPPDTEGKYMGRDSMGNRYFENKNYMIGRSRWVEYNPTFRFEYDASQVSPEWYGWLHYKTDRLPSEDWAKYCIKCCCWCHYWLLPHQENLSGTALAYYPYSTTRPKTQVWDGFSIRNRPRVYIEGW